MDEDGNLVYKLGVLSATNEVSIPLNLLFESSKDIKEEQVSLFQYIPLYEEITDSYRYYEIDGIPILEVNSLSRLTPEDETIEEFVNDSSKMRNKENLIIDLRNNLGGSMVNVEDWYKGFTGRKLKHDMITVGLYTNTSVALSKNKFETKKNEKDNIKTRCVEAISKYEHKNFFPGWSPIVYEDHNPVNNNVKVYILLDKNTSSASEFLAYYLGKLDNVILVGTNTNGCMLTGNCSSAILPNSKIPLDISNKFYINSDFTNIDGLGLIPDLWIKPEQALDRIIKHINNN